MLRHLTAACLAVLLALTAASPRVAAKPPDLPDDDPIIVSEPQPAAAPKAESVCPFFAAPDRRALADCDVQAMPSVLHNLRAMKKAAAEIELARLLGAAGRFTEAVERLDHVRKLCPGSSFARRAAEVTVELFGASTPDGAAEEQETPRCPEDCCEPLTRIRNVGACYMARVGAYCAQVQAVAKEGRRCEKACASGRPKCETTQRTVTIIFGVNSDKGVTGSIVLTAKSCECGECCPCEPACECESACPRCAKMHAEVLKKAKRKAAGVKEQVDGLMKGCYFAVGEGRNAKAADLARQAHALDPRRVEADPLVYKLHLLAGKGQCEECETPRESPPACPKSPTTPAEDNVSLRPDLPAVDPDVVPALDRVLTKRWVGEDGLERIGVEFGTAGAEEAEHAGPPCCCACCEIARAFARGCLDCFFKLPPNDYERGYVVLGLGTNGVKVSSLSKYAGMKILVQYQDGLPFVWVAADRSSR